MDNVKEVIIIGGGASGLMCAVTCALKGIKTCILESNLKVGKKILVSGNGRCNLTNKNLNKESYNNYPSQFNVFGSSQTINFFNKLGLETYFDDEGRCYPVSNHSSAVLDVLINQLNKTNCEIFTNCNVVKVEKNENFKVITSSGDFYANKVVVATGGNTAKNILSNFNLKIKENVPSLCSLITKENTKLINGIRVRAKISILSKNGKMEETGELLFKERGVSGICVFNLSAKMNWENIKNAELNINLLHCVTKEELIKKLNERKTNLKCFAVKNFFDGLFHKNLGLELINRCRISLTKTVDELTNKELEKLCNEILHFKLNVVGFDNNNQVHHGGVDLAEVTENLECKQIKNLYLCGEALNVDGVCGGYNLQWAWTSGHIVGENIWLN